MKIKALLMAMLAAMVSFVACETTKEDPNDQPAGVTVTPTELTFDENEGSQSVELKATRYWNASTTAEWVKVAQVEGEASLKPQSISISVLANTGHDREAEVTFSIGLAKARVLVKQSGAQGELDNGKGTKESPYTVAGAVEFINTLGADVESTQKVYIKGKISSVSTTFEASGNYGNASFDMVDEDGSSVVFKAFQTYYLGNRKWKSGDTDVKAGDEVIIYGKVVNYKGNTPETVGKGASFIYSLNGKSEGGDDGGSGGGEAGQAKGSGTETDPFNVAAVLAYVNSLGSDVVSDKEVYIKGKIGKITEEFGAQYGNGTFTMVDEGYGAEFTAYRILYLGNKKWKEGDTQIKVGDEVVVCGKVVLFRGNTPETQQNSAYLYSLNGNKGDNTGGDETIAEAKGTGTEADPFNVSAAIAKAKEVGETATADAYYIKGKVGAVTEQFAAQYGNATFTMIDEGYTAVFTAYRILYFNNEKWTEGCKTLSVGDEVVVIGKIVNFKGNTPETAQGSAYLYSLNGEKAGAPTPTLGVKNAAISVGASATSATISVTGNVAWTATSSDATVNPASGEGAGDITVTFAANTDTENAKTYKVTVATEADVATKSIEVVITQAKVSSGDSEQVEITLNNTTTWTEDTDDTYKGGFCATQDGVKVGFYQHASNTKPVTPDQYSVRIYKSSVFIVNAPSGKTIKSILFTANNYDSGKYCKDLTVLEGGDGKITADTSTMLIGPWTGSATRVVFQAADAQTRVEKVVIELE